MDKRKFSAPRATHRDDVAERIRLDAAEHPERHYREHIEAARRAAAEEYRGEIRSLMRAAAL